MEKVEVPASVGGENTDPSDNNITIQSPENFQCDMDTGKETRYKCHTDSMFPDNDDFDLLTRDIQLPSISSRGSDLPKSLHHISQIPLTAESKNRAAAACLKTSNSPFEFQSDGIAPVNIFVDGSNKNYCAEINRILKLKPNSRAQLSDSFDYHVTHFVVDTSSFNCVHVTSHFLMALAKNLPLFHPDWIKALCKDGDTQLRNKTLMLVNQSGYAKVPFNLSPNVKNKLFDGMEIIVHHLLPFDSTSLITEKQCQEILLYLGANTNPRTNGPPIILTTNVGCRQKIVDDLYKVYGYVTLCLEYLKDCIMKGMRLELSDNYILTSQEMFPRKIVTDSTNKESTVLSKRKTSINNTFLPTTSNSEVSIGNNSHSSSFLKPEDSSLEGYPVSGPTKLNVSTPIDSVDNSNIKRQFSTKNMLVGEKTKIQSNISKPKTKKNMKKSRYF